MSHHHRGQTQPEPPNPDNNTGHSLPVQPPNKPDPRYLDSVLAAMRESDSTVEYLARTMLLAKESVEYSMFKKSLLGCTNQSLNIDPTVGLDDAKLNIMWACGFIAGASSGVEAIDAGYILDSDDEGGEYDGQD